MSSLDAMPRLPVESFEGQSEEVVDALFDRLEADNVAVRLTRGGEDLDLVLVPWRLYKALTEPGLQVLAPGSLDETEADRRWKETFRASRGALKDLPEIDV